MARRFFIPLFLIFFLISALPAQDVELFGVVVEFFENVKNRNFLGAWNILTEKSKKTIVSEVCKEIRKRDRNFSCKLVEEDFRKGGDLFRIYWDTYRKSLGNIDELISQLKIEKVKIKGKKAEIKTVNSRGNEVKFKIFKEDDTWKFGFVETFWTIKKIVK